MTQDFADRAVLVTGGAGFLGTHLVEALHGRGASVTVLDDGSTASPRASQLPARVVGGDVRNPPPELGGPYDMVFHLASPASPPRYLLDPVGTLRTGAEGTRAILDLAAGWGARFVFTSTSEVYGDPEVHPQPETYRGAVSLTSERACYDEAKRYAEALVYAYARAGLHGDMRVARIFNTYGPGMDPGDGRVVSNFLMQALSGLPLTIYGDGRQTRSFCYVDDLIDGLIRLACSQHMGPINLGSTDEISMLELADTVAALVGDTGRVFEPLPDADPARRRPDITKAKSLLDWEPSTPLAEGLARSVDYFRSFV